MKINAIVDLNVLQAPKESKGAAMKSVVRKLRMDLSILFLEVRVESALMFLVKSYLFRAQSRSFRVL